MDDELGIQSLYTISDYYLSIVKPSVNTEKELKVLQDVFESNGVDSVLDVACGVGRHSIPLAKNGYDVTGVDLAPDQIRVARERADVAGVSVDFILEDANEFVSDEKFDAAICMWSTLGEGPMRYSRVVQNVYNSLSDNGVFVVDNSSWEDIPESREKTKEYSKMVDENTEVDTFIYDRYTKDFRVREVTTTIRDGSGDEKVYDDVCITRLFDEDDWIDELKLAGFTDFKVYHDYEDRQKECPEDVTIIAKK